MAVGYADGSVKVWDLKSASLVAHVSGEYQTAVSSMGIL